MERLQRGDLVRITGGNDKGKQGRVKSVLVDSGKVIVEGTRAEVVAHPRTREVYLGA